MAAQEQIINRQLEAEARPVNKMNQKENNINKNILKERGEIRTAVVVHKTQTKNLKIQ